MGTEMTWEEGIVNRADCYKRLFNEILSPLSVAILALVLILAPALVHQAQADTFAATGSLTSTRTNHSATLLPNGKVLIAGGYGSSGVLSSAELYDPATGTFIATGSMASARAIHSATLLPDGKVLVVGGSGSSGTSLSSAEHYDPATGTFTASGGTTSARSAHSATLLANGKVLFAGGVGVSNFQSSAELYDPVTDTFTATGSMASSRVFHSATLLHNGKVLLAGGFSPIVSSAELYDPTTGAFTATGSMASARYAHSSTLLPSGKILVAGGNGSSGVLSRAELYDPTTGAFTATGSMASARYFHSATLLLNGKALAAGGNGSLSSAEFYDPTTGSFTATSSMASARHDHSATLLPNGKVLVAGGADSSGSLSSAELYEPDAPSINVTPGTFDFGSVNTGPSSTPESFTITNSGAADLIVSSATVSGGTFSVGAGSCGTLPATIAPGGGCTVTAAFTPTTAGTLGTTLVIVSNDPTTPIANIVLNGTGVVPTFQLTATFTGAGTGTLSGTTTGTPNSVAFTTNGSSSISSGALVTITPLPTVNSAFISWSGCDSEHGNVCMVTMFSAKSITASFAINSYALTYRANSAGSINGSTLQTVNYGGSGTQVTATANPGYHFVSWSDGVTTAARTDANVTANISATANIAINSYALAYSANSGGTISGPTLQTVYYSGSSTQVTATANPGYHFVSWSDGETTSARTDVNIAANISATASFVEIDGMVSPAPGKTTPDITDALRVLQIAMGQVTPTANDLIHADIAPLGVNNKPKGDGVIDVYDVIGILRIAVGLI